MTGHRQNAQYHRHWAITTSGADSRERGRAGNRSIVGEAVGIPTTLLIGAAGLLVAGFVMHRLKVPAGDADMVPSNHWPEPLVAEPVAHGRGPVLILIEYTVEKDQCTAFLHAIDRLSRERRGDGAYGLGCDRRFR